MWLMQNRKWVKGHLSTTWSTALHSRAQWQSLNWTDSLSSVPGRSVIPGELLSICCFSFPICKMGVIITVIPWREEGWRINNMKSFQSFCLMCKSCTVYCGYSSHLTILVTYHLSYSDRILWHMNSGQVLSTFSLMVSRFSIWGNRRPEIVKLLVKGHTVKRTLG